MIDQQTRQRIIDTAQILDVVSDFISLRRQGVNYVGLCPFHSDRNPSFYVNPAKNICKCFSCGEGGTPLNFIMKHEQLSYAEALKYLAKKYNIEVVEREETEEEKQRNNERESLFVVNDFAAKFFREQLLETEEGRSVGMAYFRERGIRPETIEKFGLGYSPEGKSVLTQAAVRAGFPLKRLVEVGLTIQHEEHQSGIDRFRGRVIFPVRNLSGRYVAFGGRIMGKRDKTAKYLNSPESLIYSKSRELYGLYWAKSAIAKAGKCYLVEGYTDVLSMHQSGIENVVSSSGTALTLDQIRLIRRFTTDITVLYDGDQAGIKAALRGIDLLLEEGFRIKVVLLPDGEDPDSFARSHSSSELQSFLDEQETDFIHFKIDLFREEMARDPLRRAELITDIMGSIALIPDSIQRAVLIQSSAGILRMDEQLLASEVNKLRRRGITASGHYVPSNPTPTPATPPEEPEVDSAQEEQIAVTSPSPLVDEGSIEPFERELMQLLLLYYDHTIHIPTGMGTPEVQGVAFPATPARYRLIDFVYRELEIDNVEEMYSPLFARFIHELRVKNEEGTFAPISYFTNHEDAALRKLTTELAAESDLLEFRPDMVDLPQYLLDLPTSNKGVGGSLSSADDEEEDIKREERYLGSLAIRACNSYKMALLVRYMHQLHDELKAAQRASDASEVLSLMSSLADLNAEKRRLSNLLGDRTIVG
ncbi:DNA primase [Porphyromonas catoniae]|uniref:DNA primase n=1 Tax=Porphyromonas catoniae TaxID=41976 RepID=UPI0028D09A2A|nr:DNA primase [Porphyromonas catoniae]